MKNGKILIVDNYKLELSELKSYLDEKFLQIDYIKNYKELVRFVSTVKPEIVILPLELKRGNGIDLCAQLKVKSYEFNPFIILVSTKKEEYSLIAALDSGADDFLVKPIQERVLIGRVNALLKRKKWNYASLDDEELVIDEERFLILRGGVEYYLPKKEFQILSLLKSRPNKAFSRDEIKSSIWNNFEKVRDRTVDVHIRKIREKIGEDLISTVKGVGYRLELA